MSGPNGSLFAKRLRLARTIVVLFAVFTSAVIVSGDEPALKPIETIKITTKNSLIHLGSLDSFDRTERGTNAAKLIIEAVETKDPKVAKKAALDAVEIYKEIIPNENFGGEYTALQWLCEYIAGSPDDKKKLINDDLLHQSYYDFWAKNDFATLKEYLRKKYKLPTPITVAPKVKSDTNPNKKNDTEPKKSDTETKKTDTNTDTETKKTDTETKKDSTDTKKGSGDSKKGGDSKKSGPKKSGSGDAKSGESDAFTEMEAESRQRFLEDFILFNNPRRETWERTATFIEKMGIKEGDSIVDYGCGPGYYSFKFSNLVGKKGKVIATDLNEEHLSYMQEVIKASKKTKTPFTNIEVTETGIPETGQYDFIFLCSLYHVMYCEFEENGDRADTLATIRRTLKKGGKLVVLDNALVETLKDGRRLPYHGPYIAKELVIAQIEHNGFVHKETHQIIPQRYMLVFERNENDDAEPRPAKKLKVGEIAIESGASLANHPESTARRMLEFSTVEQRAAKDFWVALSRNDKASARAAKRGFEEAAAKYRVGAEYWAFVWVCDYILAGPEKRKAMVKDPNVKDYLDRLGGDEFTFLKKYLVLFFNLDPEASPPSKDIISEWHERIVFNNPYREKWEKTSKIMEFMDIKPGETVADVGCGHGYFTFKFKDAVGPEGRVFALETADPTLEEFKATLKKHHYDNVIPIRSTYDNCKLPDKSVDVMFMCSVYDSIYVKSIDFVQERFLESCQKALKPNARLVIVDNDIHTDGAPPYYGPRIDKRLIIEQLRQYGFKLTKEAKFTPQRYVLEFKLDPPKKGPPKKGKDKD